MIGTEYHAQAVASIIGPNHSTLIPDVMWGAWLDGDLEVIEVTGTTIAHSAFGLVAEGVANIVLLDAGVLPAGTVEYFGLLDAEVDGQLIAAAAFTTAAVESDAIVFPIGTLQFLYGAPE